MNAKEYFVYIITNPSNTVLYVGVTNDLIERVNQHKIKVIEGFSSKYNLSKLIYFESTSDVNAAIAREKQLKNWKREWKIELIEKFNPKWEDLYQTLVL